MAARKTQTKRTTKKSTARKAIAPKVGRGKTKTPAKRGRPSKKS